MLNACLKNYEGGGGNNLEKVGTDGDGKDGSRGTKGLQGSSSVGVLVASGGSTTSSGGGRTSRSGGGDNSTGGGRSKGGSDGGVNTLDGEGGRVRLEGLGVDVDGVLVGGGQVSGQEDGCSLGLQAVQGSDVGKAGDTDLLGAVGATSADVEDDVEVTGVLGLADVGPGDGGVGAGGPGRGGGGLGVVEAALVGAGGLGEDDGGRGGQDGEESSGRLHGC
ncbi:MAG: hypothetical protein JOS17DRAFT_324288 [Linnemannia elongata]|nr:MAG: hypothetical protein JOS17DRAFT_324288 [Linnemannia elongata]